jgi:hypothetical protein
MKLRSESLFPDHDMITGKAVVGSGGFVITRKYLRRSTARPNGRQQSEMLMKAAETGGGWLYFARIAVLGAKSERRARIQNRSQRNTLGKTEIGTG